jgi:membrane-bound inhibitor of C-type lysozyme
MDCRACTMQAADRSCASPEWTEDSTVLHRRWIAPVFAASLTTALLAACQRKETPPAPAPAPAPVATAPGPAATPAAGAPVAVAADDAPPEGVLRAYVWQCDDGRTFTIRNLWRENAIAIDLHDGTHKLLQATSASGAKYADASATFFSKGGEATLEASGAAAVKCHESRARSLAEDARIRGVRFRARGNEPGWTVEVGPGSALTWVTGYGQERHEYPNALASGDAASGFVYTGTGATGDIKVTIRPAACKDDMSGEVFDQQVTVSAGGRDYRGCGNRLQP